MPKSLRDITQQRQKKEEKTKKQKLLIPSMLCNALGAIVDAGGNAISARVEDDSLYVWHRSYGDAAPARVRHRNPGVADIGGTPVYLGYFEDSQELEVLSVNTDVIATPTNIIPKAQHAFEHEFGYDPLTVYLHMLSALRMSPGTGLTVRITSYEYDDLLRARAVYPGTSSFSVAASQPASGSARKILVYLDTTDNTVKIVAGTTGPDLDTVTLNKPNTPLNGITIGYVRLDGDQTAIAESDLEHPKRILVPSGASGAPVDAQYVVLALDGTLTAERTLADGAGILITDGGAGNDVTVKLAVDTLTEESVPDDADMVALYDDSGAATVKQSRGDFLGNNLLAGGDITTTLATAGWYDIALADEVNDSGITSHFKDNDASYPAGWTETTAATATNTNRRYSFWYLQGVAANTAWKYRVKSSINLESTGANAWNSFMLGPLLIRQADAGFTADWSLRFGLYRDNAGSIDEQTYIRVLVYWNSGAGSWQIQGEEKDGTNAHTGTVYTLDQVPIGQPFYLRVVVRNLAAKTARAYYGTTPVADSHLQLLNQTPTAAPTWGAMWVQIHRDRGAGIDDYVYAGALDYLSGAA